MLITTVVWLLCAMAQISLWPESTVAAIIIMSAIGNLIAILVIKSNQALYINPVSTFAILGYAAYYFYLPIILTTIELKPVTNNLREPTLTYAHVLIGMLSISVAHFLARTTYAGKSIRLFVSNRIYGPLGMYVFPSTYQLLLIGAIGIISILLQNSFSVGYQYEASEAGIFGRFLVALSPLAFAPMALFAQNAFVSSIDTSISKSEKEKKLERNLSFLYIVILITLALMRNARALMLAGIVSISLVVFYAYLCGRVKIPKIGPKEIILSVTVILLSYPLSNLAKAIVVVRAERTSLTSFELLAKTFEIALDPEQIKEYDSIQYVKMGDDTMDEY